MKNIIRIFDRNEKPARYELEQKFILAAKLCLYWLQKFLLTAIPVLDDDSFGQRRWSEKHKGHIFAPFPNQQPQPQSQLHKGTLVQSTHKIAPDF